VVCQVLTLEALGLFAIGVLLGLLFGHFEIGSASFQSQLMVVSPGSHARKCSSARVVLHDSITGRKEEFGMFPRWIRLWWWCGRCCGWFSKDGDDGDDPDLTLIMLNQIQLSFSLMAGSAALKTFGQDVLVHQREEDAGLWIIPYYLGKVRRPLCHGFG
jgi:hypothetical protein